MSDPAPSSVEKNTLPPPAISRVSSPNKDSSSSMQLWMAPNNVFSKEHLMSEVDPARSTYPLLAYCFMTGYIDAVCFSAVFVWCAFQTGNTVQLALALARLFQGPPGHRDGSFHIADKQALTSITTFLFGAFLGRIGDKIGAKTRLWLFTGTFLQCLFTMSAALCIWKSHEGSVSDARADPAWTNALSFVTIGFMSASMGLQGIMGKRVNTQFTTTSAFHSFSWSLSI
ncbi:hypothetical protein NM688_g7506 [Phlebia brevispora]|uniref:Uncharacterized protein n=1 Tax=Phlebia brevispora TaxID=194682 RepID=A0ACC1S4I8_9APHY|nr:hypothetical protein NM688_g7506 [Phlebia brevispora]